MPARHVTQSLVESVSRKHRGPGGACAALQDGKVVGQHVWGYADLEKRIPMAADTILPICSISKQFICLLLAELLQGPGAMEKADAAMREMLPPQLRSNKDLTIERLSHMQSGIRDYWALTVLWGAQADQKFRLAEDAPAALERLGNFHFAPGTSYSYSNVNFYILGRVVEELGGQPLDQLLSEHIFKPAGMHTARLHPDTNDRPGPSVGYEGVEKYGFHRAVNRIEWAGDAGIVATLNDMIAYEKYLDQQQADPNSPYCRNKQPPTFIDGSPAFYGWGLSHNNTTKHAALGHGGALRGFRLHRRHCPEARTSTVVMLNHEADAEAALSHVFGTMLQEPAPFQASSSASESWDGVYLDPHTQLAIEVTTANQKPGEVAINYSFHPETVKCTKPDHARSKSMTASFTDGVLTMNRWRENNTIKAQRLSPETSTDSSALVGEYRNEEIDSTFHVSGTAGMLYGSFDGYLGQGPAHLMRHLGEDVWYLSCQRSLDSQSPGDWTVVFKKRDDGKVVGVTVGCWLARKVPYTKV